jgi:hypothetical protein
MREFGCNQVLRSTGAAGSLGTTLGSVRIRGKQGLTIRPGKPTGMRTKTQLVVRRGEEIAMAARQQAELAENAEPLDLRGLPPAVKAAEHSALAQAATFESWAAAAAPSDVLLARALRTLAGQLEQVADQAARVRSEAEDFFESVDDEETGA